MWWAEEKDPSWIFKGRDRMPSGDGGGRKFAILSRPPIPQAGARQAFGNVTATQERWYEHSHWMFHGLLEPGPAARPCAR